MIGSLIYFLQVVMMGTITYQQKRNAKLTKIYNELVFISKFFGFITVYTFFIAISAAISDIISNALLSFLIIASRIFLLIAIIYLLRTPIFSRFEFIKKHLRLIDGLLLLSIVVGLLIIYFDFHQVQSINGIIVNNFNIYAALLLSAPSLTLGLLGSYSFFKVKREDLKSGFAKNIYLLGFGALLLGIGDFLYTIANSLPISLLGSTMTTIGYTTMVIVTFTNYIKNKLKIELSNNKNQL